MKLEFFNLTDDREQTLRKLNRLVEAVNALDNITGGPGVSIQRTSGGVTINVEPVGESRAMPGGGGSGEIENTKNLGYLVGEADTDGWALTEGRSVKVWAVTDVYYNENNLQCTLRMRPLLFDTAGALREIGPESDAMLVFTAVLCQETP